ncbi:MAG: CBS domain-containing protein [Saccharolobus sp.]|jgi:CBS domain-containing protein|uniref:CBS domain-containing protein n=1 Tax=Saccharolobus sp. TaxID=2100761 RepID=UPI0028CEEE7E|nr:CBS domain-containing protein [Saccharolobus sp.]MDT7860606.1 CBS domain-containing protein [Saccharolobus sp.]
MIERIMTKKVFVAMPDDPLVNVADFMRRNNIGSIAVINAEGKLVGILTERDIVRAVSEGRLDAKVKEYMTAEVIGVKKETSEWEAAEVMLERGFRHLPVVDDNNKVIGIVSIRDIARGLLFFNLRV